jgi:5'-phosphate synthase pdxT subunit
VGDRVGILAIQGDIEAHAAALGRIGAEGLPVLHARDLDGLDALVIPGGESTTISKGITRLELWEPLREFVAAGRPVLGTCAGAILLARTIERGTESEEVGSLNAMDVTARRNAYGTQVDSFAAAADPGAGAGLEGMRCVFIRAPQLVEPGDAVEVLMRVDGRPVLLRQGRVLACAFHPELTDDARIHSLLLHGGEQGGASAATPA